LNAYCSAASACALWKVVSQPSSTVRTSPPPPIAKTWRNSVWSRSAAALAGGGHGDDAARLGELERAELRKQARDRLRLDLAAWAQKVGTGTAADRIQAQKTLAPWRDDPDLAGLRDADTLQKLPSAERQDCQALWQEVAALLRRAQTTQ
jgi:hypothetical protein